MTQPIQDAPAPAEASAQDAAVSASAPAHSAGWRAVLALGFGTTVVMWALAYVCRLPAVQAPASVLAGCLILGLLGGGLLTGRLSPGQPAWNGARVGGLACLLNLLILGSFLAEGRAQAATWVPGTLLVGALVGAVGALIGRGTRGSSEPAPRDWVATLAVVAMGAVLLLHAVGGVVTAAEAGLAVPDWPNTYASNMFLYPLSKMTGGIYYEHTHRLLGSLVGLTTLALTVTVWVNDRRPWARGLTAGVFVLVCLQGLLGGLRVTGRLTLSTDPSDLAPSTHLAMVHGVSAQCIFALLAVVAAVLTPTWRADRGRTTGEEAEATIGASTWLVGAVFAQLVLGALVRHFDLAVTWHVVMAVVVVVLAGSCGVRARSAHADEPVIPRVGTALLVLVGLQFLLGVAALATTADPESVLARGQVVVTTAHQTCGALVLVSAVLLRAWCHRLLEVPRTT